MIKTDSIMKRVLVLLIPLLVGLASCSDQLNTNEGDEETIVPVNMQDSSGEDSTTGVLNLSWSDVQILAKSVLIENGYIKDYTGRAWCFPDVAMVVNNKEMLTDVVVPSSMSGVEDRRYQWPEIDFEKYSLVIGQFYTTFYHLGNVFTQHYIVKSSSKYILYVEIGNLGGLAAPANNYFAALYPKLPDGQLEVKRLTNFDLVHE